MNALCHATAALLLVSTLATGPRTKQQLPGDLDPGAPLSLLANEQLVQKEIEATNDQLTQVTSLHQQVAEGILSADSAIAKLADILQPPQLQRLRQISYQARGGWALCDSEAGEAIKLTPDQKTTVERIRTAEIEKLRADLKRLRFSSQQARSRFILQRQLAAGEQMLRPLTEQQRQAFEALKGKRFDTSKLFVT